MRALESLWEKTVRSAQGMDGKGMGALEKELREDILKLGGNLLSEAVPMALGTGYSHSRVSCQCGGKAEFDRHRPKTITTLVKEIRLLRAYYHCPKCHSGQVPLDKRLDVEGSSFSPGAREAICLLNSQMSFETGKDLLERLCGVRMHEEQGRILAEAKGEEMERQALAEIENVWKPLKPVPRELSDTPQRLYFSPDGTHVLTQESWKEAKVGAVFTANIPRSGQDPERLHTRYAATMGVADDLGRRLYVEALKLGLGDATQTVVVADGAHWIWKWAETSLPKNRVEIIDFYHASEKLWEVSKAVFGEESPEGVRWAKRWSERLYTCDGKSCIRAMAHLRPRGKKARECVRETIGYFKNNRERMRYGQLRRQGYFIGSGVTEASCKHLVGTRLKQAGMRWAIRGAQAILQLRVAYLNSRWDCAWLN